MNDDEREAALAAALRLRRRDEGSDRMVAGKLTILHEAREPNELRRAAAEFTSADEGWLEMAAMTNDADAARCFREALSAVHSARADFPKPGVGEPRANDGPMTPR
jgi:hypothetical protein